MPPVWSNVQTDLTSSSYLETYLKWFIKFCLTLKKNLMIWVHIIILGGFIERKILNLTLSPSWIPLCQKTFFDSVLLCYNLPPIYFTLIQIQICLYLENHFLIIFWGSQHYSISFPCILSKWEEPWRAFIGLLLN